MPFVDGAIQRGKRFIKRHVMRQVRDAYWGFYGKTLTNPEARGRPSSCLFVCKGNICRSPFAERIARKLARERSLGEIGFVSAGFDVALSLPSPVQAVQAARQFGVALDDHRSIRLTEEMIARSDMILVMEVSHLHRMRKVFPSNDGRTFLLPLVQGGREAGEENYHRFNIDDPYGQDLDLFLACYGRIARCVEQLIAGIEKGDERK